MKKIFTLAVAIIMGAVTAWADSPATFPGGDAAMTEFIQANLKYPPFSQENGIEGIVHLQMLVKSDGSIGSVKVIRMIDPDLEQEAVRLVKSMPAWTPAVVDGTAADSTVKLSITFTLPAEAE